MKPSRFSSSRPGRAVSLFAAVAICAAVAFFPLTRRVPVGKAPAGFETERRDAAKLVPGVRAGSVWIMPVDPSRREAIADFIVESGCEVTLRGPLYKGSLVANVTEEVITALSRREDVRLVAQRIPLYAVNDYAVVDTGVTNVWNSLGLTGEGQAIATADTGLDTGYEGYQEGYLHEDFSGRILKIVNAGGYTTKDYSGHGTHTAGTLAGTGEMSGGRYRGVAYGAKLYVQCCGVDVLGSKDISLEGVSWSVEKLFTQGMSKYKVYIHSDSWGGYDKDNPGAYDEYCAETDETVWRNPELLVVCAAGNLGSGKSTVMFPASAKNVIAVGNCYSSRTASSSAGISTVHYQSSRGPCKDGRIKPDVTAPGTSIVSARSFVNTNLTMFGGSKYYTSMSGTSMATPHVAGCAALIREWLLKRPEFDEKLPTAALLKAMITGGAAEMGDLPRNTQGFGRLDLAETLAPSNRTIRLYDRIPFSKGHVFSRTFSLTNAAPFEAQLVWIDYPAEPYAEDAIVNDLDLVVRSRTTGDVWYGNDVTGGDRTNTVEAVRIADAEPGEYRVSVVSRRILHDSSEGGAAALYLRGALGPEEEEKFFRVKIR